MRIAELETGYREAYEDFLRSCETSLIYHTLEYRAFLEQMVGGTSEYWLALDRQGKIQGALPLFFKSGPFGTVCNSLPFFGSIGGFIGRDAGARSALLDHYQERISTPGIVASTVVENPLEKRDNSDIVHDLTDYRIGQATVLDGAGCAANRLMESFHYKTRNMIRKAERSGVSIEVNDDAYDFLEEVHVENISSLGGQVKPPAFFSLVQTAFKRGTERRLYIASHEGRPIAAALMLYFNRTVEYFIPVISAEFRQLQPLSLIIYRAMIDAAEAGYRWWNWGGTWKSQEGVYRFKKRWGTFDRNYHYYIQVRNSELLFRTREEILASYPFYFVVPFEALNSTSKQV